jgi:hypothetical protein
MILKQEHFVSKLKANSISGLTRTREKCSGRMLKEEKDNTIVLSFLTASIDFFTLCLLCSPYLNISPISTISPLSIKLNEFLPKNSMEGTFFETDWPGRSPFLSSASTPIVESKSNVELGWEIGTGGIFTFQLALVSLWVLLMLG